jgi:hypothetical protein
MLRQAVLTDVYKRSVPGYSGKRINARKLAGIAAGVDLRGFLSPVPQKELDTYMHLLVDCSGSMCGYGMDCANLTFLALSDALRGIPKIRLQTTGFCSAGRPTVITHPGNTYTGFVANGNTPLAQALEYVFYETVQAMERRKIIFVITDGTPDNREAAKKVLAKIEQFGIQTIGILIGMVHSLFNLSVRIQNPHELSAALSAIWQDILYPDAS